MYEYSLPTGGGGDGPGELARVRAENTHLRDLVDTQRAVIADLKAERDAHRALRDNPHVSPLRKDTLEVVYELLGCPLGTSPATRPYPDTIISHEKIAQRLGVSAKQIGKHLGDMEMDGWLKRSLATATNPENGKPIKHYHYAPVEGQAFLATIGAPEGLVEHHAPTTSRLAADAVKATQRRRLIEARCPVCKTTNCTIHCSNGHRTHMDDVADAQPAAPATAHGRAALDTGADPVREDSSLTGNAPGVMEECSDNPVLDDGLSTGGDRAAARPLVAASAEVAAPATASCAVREDSSLTGSAPVSGAAAASVDASAEGRADGLSPPVDRPSSRT